MPQCHMLTDRVLTGQHVNRLIAVGFHVTILPLEKLSAATVIRYQPYVDKILW